MGLFDPVFDAFREGIRGAEKMLDDYSTLIEVVVNPQVGEQQASEIVGRTVEEAQPADEVGGAMVDIVEEFILSDLSEEGEMTPENVEQVADDTEGAAVGVLSGIGLAGSVAETISLGQIDQQQEWLMQGLAGLGVDDVTGLEMDARIEQGIAPAWEAKAAKEHRAHFVDMPDAVEYLLRHKEGDGGWLQGTNIPDLEYSVVQSNNPVNPQNALEEWGVRDDQLPILEEVALEVMEFEELIETPAELGLIVPDDVLDNTLDRAGYPEDLKDFLRQIPDQIPRSNRMWEERTAVEPLVDELETLVSEEKVTPAEAIDLIPDEVEEAKPALRDRFENLQSVPAGTPSRSQVTDSAFNGFTTIPELEDRLSRLSYDSKAFDDVLDAEILGEIDGDLREAMALGLLPEDRFGELMDRIGLDRETQAAVMAGQDLSDVVESRLQDQASTDDLPVSSIPGIGESRGTALRSLGVETVADLAGADPVEVAETTQVSPETAAQWIELARATTEQT